MSESPTMTAVSGRELRGSTTEAGRLMPPRRVLGDRPGTGVPRQRGAEITVGIVDDEVLVRNGIRRLLEQVGDMTVVGESGDGAGAVELVRRHQPQVVTMEIRLPGLDGLTAARQIRRLSPGTAVVLVASAVEDAQIHHGLRVGASGFMLKSGDPAELVGAVRAAASGHAMFSPAVARRVLNHFATIDVEPFERARNLVEGLTAREQEVLELVAAGLGNLQIARKLFLSEGAIKAHVSRLLSKLSCANRVQAAILAHDASLAARPLYSC